MKRNEVVILKLTSGDEIIAMYIKSGWDTITVSRPLRIHTSNDMMSPGVKLSKYAFFGQWEDVRIRKSQVVSTTKPIETMTRYFHLICRWIMDDLNPRTVSELEVDANQLEEIVAENDTPPGQQPNREILYTKILESLEFPERKEAIN